MDHYDHWGLKMRSENLQSFFVSLSSSLTFLLLEFLEAPTSYKLLVQYISLSMTYGMFTVPEKNNIVLQYDYPENDVS